MLSNIALNLSTMSGQTDDAKILSLLDTAAHEIWDTVDLPGVLREVRVTTDNEAYVTLPSDVYRIRAVRNVRGITPVEIVTASDRYRDYQFYQTDYTWRLLQRTPLMRRITNATRLTFRAKRLLAARCNINILGATDQGSYIEDSLRIEANSREVDSNDNYTDVKSITKDVTTNSDIEIFDAEDNLLSVIPNHVTSPQYWLAQIRENCTTVSCSECSCFDVLYKPVLPPITSLDDYFPEGFEQVLLFKALEQVYLGKSDMLDTAQAYNTKALSLLAQFQVDETIGKTLRPNVKRNHYQTMLGSVRL